MQMKITGIILAAGTSSRMGQNKLLLPYANHTIFEEVLRQLLNCDIEDIIIVTGFESERIEKLAEKYREKKIRLIRNPRYLLGRAESIKRAVMNADEDTDALLFMVADKPTVKADLISRAVSQFKRNLPPILYVMTPAGRGHPIIYSKELFSELLTLSGDKVGDELIARYEDRAEVLKDDEVQVDVDTADDYQMLCGPTSTRR